jgi:hypothetical protein
MLFEISQELNIHYKHLNPFWLFDNYIPDFNDNQGRIKLLIYAFAFFF